MTMDEGGRSAADMSSGSGAPWLARVDNLSFRYPDADYAVADVSFDICAGRSIGIVGPSGCGKSTLLALMAGLLKPTAGAITWSPCPPNRHPLSMVFQKDTVLPWLNVRKNVALSDRLRGARRAGRGRKDKPPVDELIAMIGLSDWGHAYPKALSGGMRRRVAFLQSIAPMPRLILLDEPFSALDEPTRVGIHQDVFHIAQEYDMTMVLVTHDLAEAISLCDEVLILSRSPGRIVSRHDVPFGRERTMLEIRHESLFLKLYGTLWDELKEQIEASEN